MKKRNLTSYLYHFFKRSRLQLPIAVAIVTFSCTLPVYSHAHIRTLNIVSPWEIKSPDPVISGSTFMGLEIIEALTSVDHEGKLQPCLSTSWTTSLDNLKWKFTLRKGVKFHDGSPMTTEAVVQSLQRSFNKPGLLKKAPITGIAVEEDVVSITLERPYAILPSVLSHYTTAILAPAAYTEDGDVQELIATGPYKVLFIKPPQELQARHFRHYWGDEPSIKATHYLAVSRNETRSLMAQSGDADIIYTLDPMAMKRLERFKRISTFTAPLPRAVLIKLNCDLPGLETAEQRKALSEGLDRKGISTVVMRREGAEADQLFPPSLGSWHLPLLAEHKNGGPTYKELMTSQGWAENDKGYLEKNSKILEMTITTYADRPELPVTATALQDQMRNMGIKLNVSISSSSSIPLGHADNTLEMGLFARNYGKISNPLGAILQDYSSGGGDWGAMNWSNPEIENLLKTLEETTDIQKQQEFATKASWILYNEMPCIPILAYQQSAVVTKDLVNFSLDPLERNYRISEMQWVEE